MGNHCCIIKQKNLNLAKSNQISSQPLLSSNNTTQNDLIRHMKTNSYSKMPLGILKNDNLSINEEGQQQQLQLIKLQPTELTRNDKQPASPSSKQNMNVSIQKKLKNIKTLQIPQINIGITNTQQTEQLEVGNIKQSPTINISKEWMKNKKEDQNLTQDDLSLQQQSFKSKTLKMKDMPVQILDESNQIRFQQTFKNNSNKQKTQKLESISQSEEMMNSDDNSLSKVSQSNEFSKKTSNISNNKSTARFMKIKVNGSQQSPMEQQQQIQNIQESFGRFQSTSTLYNYYESSSSRKKKRQSLMDKNQEYIFSNYVQGMLFGKNSEQIEEMSSPILGKKKSSSSLVNDKLQDIEKEQAELDNQILDSPQQKYLTHIKINFEIIKEEKETPSTKKFIDTCSIKKKSSSFDSEIVNGSPELINKQHFNNQDLVSVVKKLNQNNVDYEKIQQIIGQKRKDCLKQKLMKLQIQKKQSEETSEIKKRISDQSPLTIVISDDIINGVFTNEQSQEQISDYSNTPSENKNISYYLRSDKSINISLQQDSNIPQMKRLSKQENLQDNSITNKKYILYNQQSEKLIQQDNIDLISEEKQDELSNYLIKEFKNRINQYVILKTIGKGNFGKVKLALDILNNNRPVAIKIIKKKHIENNIKNQQAIKSITEEIAIMKKLDHENIVKIYEILDYQQKNKLYIVMEYYKHGSLINKLNKSKNIQAHTLWKYFRDIILGIKYLHDCGGFVLKDLKPHNMMLDENDRLKLSDIGMTSILENGCEDIQSTIDTNYFYAPEICQGSNYQYEQTDIWSLGVTLYYIMFKKYPFQANNLPNLYHKIIYTEPEYPQESNQLLIEFLKKFFIKDPEKRITLTEIIQHDWVTSNGIQPLQIYISPKINISEQDKNLAVNKEIQMSQVIVQIRQKQNVENQTNQQQLQRNKTIRNSSKKILD